MTNTTYYYYILNSITTLTGLNRSNLIDLLRRSEEIHIETSMGNRNIEHGVLDYTMDFMERIVAWYDENKVDSNEIDNSIEVERQLTDENRVLRHVTTSIGQAIMSVVSEDQQRQIMEILRERLAVEGIRNVNLLM